MTSNQSGNSRQSAPAGVSQARLHQPANSQPVNGYAKVNHGNGTFSMKKAGQ